jgi:hypothetical protein
MNYFKTTMPVDQTRAFIKTQHSHQYEYCILSRKDKSCLVISNSRQLTEKLKALPDGFYEVSLLKKERKAIYQNKEFDSTLGNLGLLLT